MCDIAPVVDIFTLSNAARHNNISLIHSEIKAGLNVNMIDSHGNTLLHFSAGAGHLELSQLLIDSGADVNAKNEYGQSPLSCAAHNGYPDMSRLLLELGANVNETDVDHETPLHRASREKRYNVIRVLLAAGADILATNSRGEIALDLLVPKDDLVRSMADAVASQRYNTLGDVSQLGHHRGR